MTTDYEKFFKFLNYLMENTFSNKYDTYLDTITDISSSDIKSADNMVLIESDEKLLNLDKIKDDLYDNCLNQSKKASSMDSVYFKFKKNNFKLFLIEFKGERL